MRYGCHVGWLGGTEQADRSDWAGLAKLGWKNVVIVADNDDGGVDVAAKLAEHFRCRVDVMRFDGLFTETFDLGDPFPDDMWDKHKRYTGPSFEDCLIPSDWATDTVLMPTGTSGRLALELIGKGDAEGFEGEAHSGEIWLRFPGIPSDGIRVR